MVGVSVSPASIPPDRALRFEVLFDRAISIERVTFEEVSQASSIPVPELKRRLNEPVGFVDAPVEKV